MLNKLLLIKPPGRVVALCIPASYATVEMRLRQLNKYPKTRRLLELARPKRDQDISN